MNHNTLIVDQFTQQAASYTQLTTLLAGDRAKALRAMLQPAPTDVALEVCCGPGALGLDIASAVKHLTAMDITPAMLDQGRLRQARLGLNNVTWTIGDVNAIPYDDESFSIVMCGSAFHHLPDPKQAFDEMIRVCRPGGRILVRDVTPEENKIESYDRIETMRDPSHVHALTVDELRALGADRPVEEIALKTKATPHLCLEAVLATSFPEAGNLDEIRALLREDAAAGTDRFGLFAALVEGQVHIAYRMSTALWRRRA